MSPRRLAVLAALCGTAVLAGSVAAGFLQLRLPGTDHPGRPLAGARATAATIGAAVGVPILDEPSLDVALPPRPMPRSGSSALQLVSVSAPDPAQGPASQPWGAIEPSDECAETELCIDRYLWSLYERAPKVDTIKVPERVKVKVTKKGKTRTVTKTVIRLVDEDFTWKDPKAAQKAGMPLMTYVIGGMDRGFKLRLYHALRAMDDAGLFPGITSGFRDDYRQSLASGNKAATDSSYHGGSRRGGYGHGLAADIVSVKGETRAQRWISSENLWKWIDARGKEFGIGRPYLDRDAPHVGPIDGKEYVEKRARPEAQRAELRTKKSRDSAARDERSKPNQSAAHHEHSKSVHAAARDEHSKKKRAKTTSSKVRNI